MGRGRGRGSSSATTPARGRDAPWRPTEVQRAYRDLLDRAKDEPQTILDADGSQLVVEAKEEADFAHGVVEHLSDAARFQAAYGMHADEEPARWAAATPYPWLASFDRDEVAEFARELVAYALDAAQRRTLESLEGNLRAWRSTAEIYERPEVLAQLQDAIDPREIVEVFPPSEDEVRDAEGGAA